MNLIVSSYVLKIIQRRGYFGEPRETFYRNWTDYKHGFGRFDREFWLGNDNIYQLTKSGDMKLRVELEAHDGRTAWAEYDTFRCIFYRLSCLPMSIKYIRVEDEDQEYLLHIGGYSGTTGDSMTNASYSNNGMKFSTQDRDNDLCSCNCAQEWTGGWWFKK